MKIALVKFFGTLQVETQTKEIEVNEKYIDDILRHIDKQYANIEYTDLKSCIIFINNKKYKKPMLKKTEIGEKDVIYILFPVAGG